jgi:cytochrome c-type protein NapB
VKATAEQPEADDGLDVYFRDTDLDATSPQALVQYFDDEPGESTVIERAFSGAPPQIPHTVEDMLPIQTDENECLDCHHPENVTGKEEIPMPESHFEVPRMGRGKPGDAMVWKVEGYQKGDDLAGSRYNCSMCHTPQARSTRTPVNRFESPSMP